MKTFEVGKTYFRKADGQTFEYKINSRNGDRITANDKEYVVKNYHNDTEFVVLQDAISPIGGDVILLFAENKSK